MKLERLNQDKIRIFLTFDDLLERGINKNDMWQDIPKVHELFNDMMNQAYRELNFEVQGPVAVEIFSMPAQGMVVVVTRGKEDDLQKYDIEEENQDDYYELEVTLDESEDILFRFHDFDDVIHVCHQLKPFISEGGHLFHYEGKYLLLFSDMSLESSVYDLLIAVLSEFGEASTMSKFIIEEYGKPIIEENAVQQVCTYFSI